MRKLTNVFLIMGVAACLCGCQSIEDRENKRNNKEKEQVVDSVEEATKEAVDNSNEKESESEETDAEKIEVLNLDKTLKTRYEWNGDSPTMLVRSEYSQLTMGEEDAKKYPQMARALQEISNMQRKAMEEEADNLLSMAKEILPPDPVDFDTFVSTVDVQVRRADSQVVSWLSDSYSDYGNIRDFRGMHGSNYDTKTGQELMLSDVVLDMGQIPALVKQELTGHIWNGELYSDTIVSEYFQNTPEDGISWTLDYNGITFYFADGDLAEPGNGRLTATILFTGHEDIFNEAYTGCPDAYMVALPVNSSFFTDLNGDGDSEELKVSGEYREEDGFYTAYGLYTDIDGYYYYEEYFSYGFCPYYVKMSDGSSYLYLFAKEEEIWNRQMELVVLSHKEGQFTKVGEKKAGPYYKPSMDMSDDIFAVPTNPEAFYLDDFEDVSRQYLFEEGVYKQEEAVAYRVGSDGMPQKK